MPARRLTDVTLVLILGVLMVVIGIAGAFVAPGPNPLDAGTSTYSAGRRGTKALYLTLRELGYRAERSHEPMTAMTAVPGDTVLVLSGDEPASDQDRRAIRQFLERGGVVLAIGSNGAAFLGFSVAPKEKGASQDPGVVTYPRTSGGGQAARISMPADAGVPSLPKEYTALFGDDPARPVVASADVGPGRAIWWAAPTPMSNEHVDDADNLALVLETLGAAGPRRVLFDEHYHGFKRSLWSYAAGTPLPWIGVQAGLAGLALILTFSRRHGPVRPPVVDPRTSPMEFVETLGALYQRAGATAAAVTTARHRLRRTVAATCGVPVTAEDEALAAAAQARLGAPADALGDLLARARAASDSDLGVDEAMTLTRNLQAWTARLHASRVGRAS